MSNLEFRKLGKNGPEVSPICLGTWPLGGGMGVLEESDAIKTVHASIDYGANFIDTAESYLESERILGKALVGLRDKVFLASKLSGEHSPEHIKKALHNSLKKLRTDYLDLYQIHSWKDNWKIEDTFNEILKYKDKGLIKHIGVSNFDSSQISTSQKTTNIQSCQPHFSILFRASKSDPIDYCFKNGVGVIIYSPLARGLLTGKYKPGHKFNDDDHRKNHKAFSQKIMENAWAMTKILSDWAKDYGKTCGDLAIAWSISTPGVTSAICGAKTPKQAINNALAGTWKLSNSQLNEIETLIHNLTIDYKV